MKCPKCGFTSFDFLENCKKCGSDLQTHKSRFGLRSLIFPGLAASVPTPEAPRSETVAETVAATDTSTDFGFDFMGDEAGDAMPGQAAANPVSEDDGFDFPADEPGSNDPGAGLAMEEDDTFGFSAESPDELEVSEDDLDFDNWDDTEETETKKKPGVEEDPTDPFDVREPAAGERAPVTTAAPDHESEARHANFSEPLQGPDRVAEAPEEITWARGQVEPDEVMAFVEPVVLLPTLSRRITATCVDIIVLAVVFLLFLVAGELTLGEGSGFWLPSLDTVIEQAVPYFLVLFALCFGYFTLFHFLTGQTPGKMLCELRVESSDGTSLQFSQAFLRSVGGLIAMLPCGLGYLSVPLSRQGRGWNDRFAGSRLVALFGHGNDEQTEPVLEA